MNRTVGVELDIVTHVACDLELQIAVARSAGLTVTEHLSITDESGDTRFREVPAAHGGRLHLLTLPTGVARVRYTARIGGAAQKPAAHPSDLSLFRRPSRFVESDTFGGFSVAQFGGLGGVDLLDAVSSWVGTRLTYVPGSSGPADGATQTLLSGMGVCRDYAHLAIAFLRALGIPARLVAVYAPGCEPMDFHAVVEAFVEGGWHVVDSTALAPRSSLVRIATGRDAVDTAFMTTVSGLAELDRAQVTAIADDGLPGDDLGHLVAIR